MFFPVDYEYEYVYEDGQQAQDGGGGAGELPLDRFSVAPPSESAPLPPGAVPPPVALAPRSLTGPKGAKKNTGVIGAAKRR